MSSTRRQVIAIAAAVAAVYAAGWFDGSVMLDIERQAGRNFDPNGLELAMSLGWLTAQASVLLLGVLAWRSRSVAVGVAYVVAGAFLAFLPAFFWRFAVEINGSPPVLPRPIADWVGHLYLSSNGPLNAVQVIGAGMLVIGLLVLGRAARDRSVAPVAEDGSVQPGSEEAPARA